MSKTIRVDYGLLQKKSESIVGFAGEYSKQYGSLFSEVDAMGEAWKGVDNTEYVTKIKAFRDDFDNMLTQLNNYSRFLSETAKTYKNAQDAVRQSANTNLKSDF